MHQLSDYDVVIFDCDGVILDSNSLKIAAMRNALSTLKISTIEVEQCTSFFAENFGKSRFFHIDHFVNNILSIEKSLIELSKNELLTSYSQQCKSLYLVAQATPSIITLLTKCTATKYVASGSEQQELRGVFQQRELDSYFENIFGSPEKKVNHVTSILNKHPSSKAVMIGDAVSDLEAAKDNNIDFIFYSPFSNVEKKMRELCLKFNYRMIDSFEEVLPEL